MPYQFTVSPDFTPEHIAGWHIFNTWLQKQLGEAIHLELYQSFDAQHEAILGDRVDLIYANPYDASVLVRDKGFRALARPQRGRDEAIVVVNAANPAQRVEDLQPGLALASTDDPGVRMMGMIMLEPADLGPHNIRQKTCDSYVLVAKELIRGTCDVGLFLDRAFADLSAGVRRELRPLVSSQIHVIHHALMIGPRMAGHAAAIQAALLAMAGDAKGQGVLQSLGLPGWEGMESEETEFMIDLMDTLKSA